MTTRAPPATRSGSRSSSTRSRTACRRWPSGSASTRRRADSDRIGASADQPALKRDRDGLCPGVGPELGLRVANVRLHGRRRELEQGGDLAVGVPAGQQRQHLALTRGRNPRRPAARRGEASLAAARRGPRPLHRDRRPGRALIRWREGSMCAVTVAATSTTVAGASSANGSAWPPPLRNARQTWRKALARLRLQQGDDLPADELAAGHPEHPAGAEAGLDANAIVVDDQQRPRAARDPVRADLGRRPPQPFASSPSRNRSPGARRARWASRNTSTPVSARISASASIERRLM